ncbi:hypothetical protein [Methylosinus sp. Sm6]|uniref:hypothetical protein n=1 Tax=Methylosinus sp. Sm6 TaxID=2866948 RepID=UPI001C99F659|nr:hypothetical protein [Methylosinus sp. Sm6]MBY6240664.1 hypothetical protein [Methylosinus sp. Sm6]
MTAQHRTDELIAQLAALAPEELQEQIEAVERYLRSDAGRAEFGNLSALAAQERGEAA